MSASFKLLYVENHSKDLLAEINFLVWRPYLKATSSIFFVTVIIWDGAYVVLHTFQPRIAGY